MAMKKTTTKTTVPPAPAVGPVTTSDHDRIRAWAEARGGKPAAVGATGNGDDVGIRLEFPGGTDATTANTAEIPWDEFFQKFDAAGLALVYHEDAPGGEQSNVNKLVKRETPPAPAAVTPPPAAKKVAKKAAKKKGPAVAKTTAKKTPPAPKKTAPPIAKKSAAKKSAAKKTAKKVPVAKKAVAKKTVAKKAVAKKTAAKKTSTKKVPPSRGFRGR